jgi:hypothetical protein
MPKIPPASVAPYGPHGGNHTSTSRGILRTGPGSAVQFDLFKTDEDVLLTRTEAANYIGRSANTLADWARKGFGPRVVRLGPDGRGVRYRLGDLRQFVEASASPIR